MRKATPIGYLALAIVSIFWGTTYMASSIGVRHLHGITLSGLRQGTAGLILVLFFLVRGNAVPPRAVLGKLFMISLLMLVGSNGLMTWSMKYIPSGLGAIISATVPIWITLFSFFLVQRTRISLQLGIGLLLGFAGVAAIFYNYLASMMNPDFRFGIMLCVFASMCWALGSVLTAKWALHINFLYGAGYQMLFGGAVMLLISTLFIRESIQFSTFSAELWESLLYLILVGSLLAYGAYVYVLNNMPTSLAAVYAYINPIVAVLLGWFWLKEELTWMMGIGTLITLFGVYLVNGAVAKNKQLALTE
ncbi:EamA-like transporter family protein [Chitinophaga jiangningensis]|uniref:EamA-like transporter family protein n=1 Tax=Chitinophaga jiangningensis TaxID=1419482 RepID=A0A1M6Y1N8_9BACT|nr:EamA family transporter [Chitinophaga jiangningensis]SHL12161.1 EamA-like transporter family protein [Chitinophaga jiangningensis]